MKVKINSNVWIFNNCRKARFYSSDNLQSIRIFKTNGFNSERQSIIINDIFQYSDNTYVIS